MSSTRMPMTRLRLNTRRVLMQRSLIRLQSTQPQPQAQAQAHPQPPESSPPKPQSKHGDIYKLYWPAIIHALAIASITMYGLEWWRLSLSLHFVQQDRAQHVSEQQHQLHQAQDSHGRQGLVGSLLGTTKGQPEGEQRWWKFW